MKILIQRVREASVEVDGTEISKIGSGLLLFLGVFKEDTEESIEKLIKKVLNLRIMPSEGGIRSMDRSVVDCEGEIIVVSQFTLYADCKKGNRPSFSNAMAPEDAEKLYELFVDRLKALYPKVKTGQFGADMKVKLINDGPVTIMLEA